MAQKNTINKSLHTFNKCYVSIKRCITPGSERGSSGGEEFQTDKYLTDRKHVCIQVVSVGRMTSVAS